MRAGGRLWALPAPMVEQVQQIKAEDLINLYVDARGRLAGPQVSVPLPAAPARRHRAQSRRRCATTRCCCCRAGQNLAAVHVDEMIGNQEVVVKNIGPQLARVSGHRRRDGAGHRRDRADHQSGAARAAAGRRRPRRRWSSRSPQAAAAAARPRPPRGPPLVMIVDDSLTVRKITSRLLTREGFDVITAKDGLDALQLLGERTPDVILLDIEMPRMDGFEFAKTIKADPQARAHPDHHDHLAHRGEASQPRRRSSASTSTSASRTRKKSCCATCARCSRCTRNRPDAGSRGASRRAVALRAWRCRGCQRDRRRGNAPVAAPVRAAR